MGWKARVNKISILLQDAFFLSGAKATVSKCNVLTIGIVLRRSAGVLLGRIHCQSGSGCCRRFRFGCLGPARSPRSLKRFIPNRSSGSGEIARLCHAACFPSAEGVAGNRMRTASPDAESGGTRGFMLSCRDILGGRLFRDVPRQGWDKGGLSRLRVCSCAGWRCFRVPENRAGETGLGGIARRSEFGE